MKVTIITATYNSENTIEQTLESVLEQTYSDIEHIIIDGNSSDNTGEIVKKYSHVSIFVSEPDKGIYDAMNKGLELATGDIIAILNSDDIFYNPKVIESIVNEFQKSNCDILYGNTLAGHFDKNGDFSKVTREVKPGFYNRRKFLFGWMPSHVSTYIKRSVYLKYGNFVDSFKIGADFELMLRFMFKHQINSRYIDRFCVKFRVGGVSTSTLKNKFLALNEAKLAWKMNALKPYFFSVYLKPMRALSNIVLHKLKVKRKSNV